MATALTQRMMYSEGLLGLSKREMKDYAALPARLAVGSSMLYHGLGKLKPEGREQYVQMFEQLGIKPARLWLTATGLTELFAGVASLLGIGTRLAALGIVVTQAVAIAKVHAPNGFDITKKGFEYNLALIATALGFLLTGPGKVSAHEGVEHLLEGKGGKKLFRRARPNRWLSAIRLIK